MDEKIEEVNDIDQDLEKDIDIDMLNEMIEDAERDKEEGIDSTISEEEITDLIAEFNETIEKIRALRTELKELRAKGDDLTPEDIERINEIKAELKSLPTIKELIAKIRNYKKITGFKTIKGVHKESKIDNILNGAPADLDKDFAEPEQENTPKKPEQKPVQEKSKQKPDQNKPQQRPMQNSAPKQATDNSYAQNSQPSYNTVPLIKLDEHSVIESIDKYANDGKERKAEGLMFSYIKPIISNGQLTSFRFVQESLDKPNEDNINFSKDPLKAYKHALKEKMNAFSALRYYDNNYLKKVEKDLLNSFKKELENNNINLCVEKYISIKTALTKDEFKTVINDDRYPLSDYNVNMVSLAQDKKTLFKKHVKSITFEKVKISSEELHGEPPKKVVNRLKFKPMGLNKKIKFKRRITRIRTKNNNMER